MVTVKLGILLQALSDREHTYINNNDSLEQCTFGVCKHIWLGGSLLWNIAKYLDCSHCPAI